MKRTAFTLVELIVAIAIVGMISVFGFARIRSNGPNQEVELQAANIVSLLRKAQVQSISGHTTEGFLPENGYGIHIDNCVSNCIISLFADNDGDFLKGSTEVVEIINFTKNISLDTGGQPTVDIIFRPPRGVVCLEQDCQQVGEVRFTINHLKASISAQIIVNKVSGKISSVIN
jgi:prepilin-type N-terminal cleavage/methylation domain-containing protein